MERRLNRLLQRIRDGILKKISREENFQKAYIKIQFSARGVENKRQAGHCKCLAFRNWGKTSSFKLELSFNGTQEKTTRA